MTRKGSVLVVVHGRTRIHVCRGNIARTDEDVILRTWWRQSQQKKKLARPITIYQLWILESWKKDINDSSTFSCMGIICRPLIRTNTTIGAITGSASKEKIIIIHIKPHAIKIKLVLWLVQTAFVSTLILVQPREGTVLKKQRLFWKTN